MKRCWGCSFGGLSGNGGFGTAFRNRNWGLPSSCEWKPGMYVNVGYCLEQVHWVKKFRHMSYKYGVAYGSYYSVHVPVFLAHATKFFYGSVSFGCMNWGRNSQNFSFPSPKNISTFKCCQLLSGKLNVYQENPRNCWLEILVILPPSSRKNKNNFEQNCTGIHDRVARVRRKIWKTGHFRETFHERSQGFEKYETYF